MTYEEEYIPIGGDNTYIAWVKPTLRWFPHKKRQKTVERKINTLLRRHKAFYLETLNFEGEPVTWQIDSWGWTYDQSKDPNNDFYDHVIGHIKNCLEFLGGSQRLWDDKKRSTRRRRTVKRGLAL